ncbi:BamA/TamA family outer membrane protein [Erythrobacter mangrovi]|uniref:BamA/TamA family outer membrane protein n=1 Tax=Erythrobacter mangrovi TaxID=2739433 RepID=A0A7D3XJF6_9SPHN|nr:BamA/TamA family outer membrane protein [Erythrobacter mangrovi]
MNCAAGLALAGPLAAQEAPPSPSLEDLIPDAAVEDPDGWSGQGAEQGATEEAEPDLAADTPIAELPEMELAWPDDIELDALQDLEPEEDIEFAQLLEDRRQVALDTAPTEAISDRLVLGFPQREPVFEDREEFVARFTALSTIEQLEDGEENVAQLAARARQDEELLGNLLRVYGFYDGRILRTISSREATEDNVSERPRVRFDVIPGTRYRFGAIDLGQLDAALDAAALRGRFAVASGDFLQSDRIVAERFNLDWALGETGYPFAEIDEPELLIDHEREEGDLAMPVRPNGKYVFGEVVSSDPAFLSSRHLANIARFEAGEVYKRSLDFDLRRAVTATGLVSTVSVTPREVTPPQGDEPGVVAMDVTMERAKLRTIAGAIGYGSEEGVRVEASWEHRNLFPPEGALRIRGIVGTQEQLAGVTFRRNNLGGRDKVLTLDAYASSVSTTAYEADTVALTGSYERLSNLLFQKPLSWGVGAELLATDERNRVIGGVERPRQTYFIASLFGRATLDSSDSLLDPTRGFRLSAYLAPETSRSSGQQYTYLRNQFDVSFYQSVGEKTVLAARGRFASIQGAPLFAVAPSRRLYAGGGSSVRGYGYQSVGPKNDFLEATGGRSLVEASVEARIGTGLFGGALSVVPFFDLGAVSIDSTPDFRFVKYGAGLGFRYATGFGPIRLDLGVPINPDPEDSSFAVYVSLGQAF